jgi:hypothetical protein
MPNTKRKEQAEASEAPHPIERKKQKRKHISILENKDPEVVKAKEKSAVVETVALTPTPKPNAVRIIVGSYEKVLCGIDARFDTEAPDTVCPLANVVNF